MSRSSPFLVLSLGWTLIVAVGCGENDPSDDDASDDDASDDDASDDDVVDDDSADDPDAPVLPCDSGTSWGYIDADLTDEYLHVRTPDQGGDDSAGDGSASAPLATLDAALTQSRIKGQPKLLCVGEGVFDAQLDIGNPSQPEGTDDGFGLVGCGVDQTSLMAADDGQSVIQVSGAQGIELSHFSTDGGRRAIQVFQGSSTGILDVVVREAGRLGVIFSGWDSIVSAEWLVVEDTRAESMAGGLAFGYGIAVQEAEVELTDCSVSGSTKVGILVDFADVAMTNVSVDGTSPDQAGNWGRGIQVQNASILVMDGCAIGTLEGNREAGVFSQASLWMEMNNTAIDATGAGMLPGAPCSGTDCPGEGLVVTQGQLGEDPAGYLAFLEGNIVTNSTRAGILVDSVSAQLDNNVAGADNGLHDGGTSIYAQGDLYDAQGSYVLGGVDTPIILDDASALVTNDSQIEPDELSD